MDAVAARFEPRAAVHQPGNATFELVSAATIDFFDGTLKGHPEQLDAMAQLVAASNGVGTLER